MTLISNPILFLSLFLSFDIVVGFAVDFPVNRIVDVAVKSLWV